MSRRDSALPKHSWLFFNRLRDYMAYAFIVLFIISFVAVYTIRYSLKKDCSDIYKRDVKIFSYWIHVESGSLKDGCPGL